MSDFAMLNKWAEQFNDGTSFRAGKAGSTRRGMSGSHVHVIRTMNHDGRPVVSAMCAPNAQVGATFGSEETITCAKCAKWMERARTRIAG